MIFSLFFGLIMAGYSACGLLLGSYMRFYTGASSLDLGFVFMLQPLCVFLRLFISARADRHQLHKRMLTQCVALNAVAYVPFIVVPFLLRYPEMAEILTQRRLFWILAFSHLLGSVGFCGTRTLGDALAVNFAKRTGSDFAVYRKYGSISFGSFGFLLGLINQNWILPDFVPALLFNSICMGFLALLIYLWPDEYFVIAEGNHACDAPDSIPTGSEVARRMLTKLCRRLTFRSDLEQISPFSSSTPIKWEVAKKGDQQQQQHYQDDQRKSSIESTRTTDMKDIELGSEAKGGRLTAKQQVDIFLLLLRRDIRIPLFLLFLFYGGLTGYAPQNFVYTYMNMSCDERGTCDGSHLSGLTMLIYCFVETIVYLLISRYRNRMNYFYLLELTLLSLTFHYYFYGFLVDHLSPYFFLVEALHGLEYGLSLSTSCELGHKFASEVELLIPELEERQIIDKETDLHLVRVSLMATMNGCFTLVYDGFGTIIGAFLYGLIIEKTSFQTNWIIVGSMALAGVVVALLVVQMGKCLGVEPQIERISKVKAQPPTRMSHV